MDIPLIEEPETRGPAYPCDAFRWVFRVTWAFIGFQHQHRWAPEIAAATGVTWSDNHGAIFGVWWHPVAGEWRGAHHAYYDGTTHCTFRVGPFVLQWFNPRCSRCWGEK